MDGDQTKNNIYANPAHRQNCKLVLERLFEKYGTTKIYNRNEVVWSGEKKSLPYVFFIKYGYVQVTTQEQADDEYIYMIYGPWNMFSVITLLNLPYLSVNYTTLKKAKIHSMPVDLFNKILMNRNDISYAMIQYLLANTIVLAGTIEVLRYKKVKERLISNLLFLIARFGKVQGNQAFLDKAFNHRILAGQINSTRESVSREINKLRKKNIISSSPSQIEITDLKRLVEELDKSWGP